jgi:VanZ family protein
LFINQNNYKSIIIFKSPAVLYAVIIFIFSSLPGNDIPTLNIQFGDKIIHTLEYIILGILLYNAFRYPVPFSKPVILTLVCGILYALSDEIHQFFVPGRFCDLYDFLADATGIIISAFLSAKLNSKK